MGEVPFRDVYIHAIVRDELGQKMSKSKGNVIDPLDIIDEYGADAFRFTLAAFAAMGRDVRLAADRIAGYRNFVNKLWNAARYVEIKRDAAAGACRMPESPKLVTSRWIRSRLAATIQDVREALDGYRFNDAATRLYQFAWHEFCDWYIELSKVEIDGSDESARDETVRTLTAVLEHLLRLLHPLTPFVTEEIWQSLPAESREGDTIMLAAYPAHEAAWRDQAADAEIGTLIEVIRAVRNIRAEVNVAPKVDLELYIVDGPAADVVRRHEALVRRLARVSLLERGAEPPAGCATAVAAGTEISVPIAEHVDLEAETTRLKKEIGRLDVEVGRLDKKLSNEAFLAKAPEEIVEQDRTRREEVVGERETLQRSLERIESIGGVH
jgi:valyl-tRNA synthetase